MRRAELGQISKLLLALQQPIFLRHRPKHGVRFNQTDLRCQKLVGIIVAGSRGRVADDACRRLPVDIDHRRGFENRRHSRRDNERCQLASRNECQDFPAVPPEHPEMMRERRCAVVGFPFDGRRPVGISRHPHILHRRRQITIHHLPPDEQPGCGGGSESDNLLERCCAQPPALVVGHVKNVVGLKCDIWRLARNNMV